MSDFTAKFFLDIYEPEVLGAKDGVVHPDPQIFDGIKNFGQRLTDFAAGRRDTL